MEAENAAGSKNPAKNISPSHGFCRHGLEGHSLEGHSLDRQSSG